VTDYETLQQLTDRIYYLPADHRTDRPILAAILGDRRVLMVDAGASPAHAQLFLDELDRVTHRHPDWVALTHWHWDHVFGLSHLSIPSFGHANLTKNLARLQGRSWTDEALAARVARGEETAFCAENIRKEYGERREIGIVLPTITFEQALFLDLGGLRCELHHIPTDHTDDAVAVYVVEEGTLFLGDALAWNMHASPPYYTAKGVSELMGAIDRFPATWYVESHLTPVHGEAFRADNRILTLTANLIHEGVAEETALVAAIEQRMAGQLPEDHKEVVRLFLNGQQAGR
jgi:glyoxylase-like metal-dependent hydrolase (beta-lactamase superfamily II)